jgi:hypothetical protein
VVAAPPPQQGEFGTSPLTEARQNPATNRDGVQRHPTRETLLRPCHTLRVIRQLFGDLKIYISRGKRGLRGGLLKRHRMNASPRGDTAKDTVVVGVVLLGGKTRRTSIRVHHMRSPPERGSVQTSYAERDLKRGRYIGILVNRHSDPTIKGQDTDATTKTPRWNVLFLCGD